MAEPAPYLKTREWVVIIVYISLMAAITLVTQVIVPKHRPEASQIHLIQDNQIEASISGAVEKPGLYSLKRGSTTQDLIALAKPLRNAQISKINLHAKLTQGRHIKIPSLETVCLRIEGAVEVPLTLAVAKGTKLKELFDCVAFTETADTRALLKERVVRDGETVVIPEKKRKTREKYCKKT